MAESRTGGGHASIGFLLLAGAMSAFPPVTTDIYLPALPDLTASLKGTTAEGQATLAMYFLGLGVGQIFYGPWSDRAGRRPTMLIGVALYLAATAGCALATSMHAMIALRFVQAVGACSGVVISAAMVRDLFDRQESARIFSILMVIRGLGPILAPLAGGVIVTLFGWRAIFWALAAFAAALGASVFLAMRETRTAEVAERARHESPLRAYAAVLKQREILGYMVTNGLNFASMFAWIAAAPYLVIGVYKVPAIYFGWIFGLNAAGFMAAAQINKLLLKRHPADLMMSVSAIGAALAAAVLLVDVLTGFGGVLGIFIPLFVVVSSLGLVSTNAMAGGLSVDPSRAGTVSAMFGTAQYALGGLATVAGAFISHNTALAMSVVILTCASGAAVFPLVILRRRSRLARELRA